MNNINYCHETNQIITKKINGENICFFTFFGDGGRQQQEIDRHAKVMEYQQKVLSKFDIPMNYVKNNFNYRDFGDALNNFTQATKDMVDYWVHFDIDCIPLRKDAINEIYDKIRDKKSIWGIGAQSNHVFVNNSRQHAYCYTAAFAFASDFYKKIGEPNFRHSDRGDIGEELTWRAQELGYTVSIVYPKSFIGITEEEHQEYGIGKYADLDNGFKYGMGTTYGDNMFYHGTAQIVPRSTDLFMNECEKILGQDLNN